MRTRRFIWTAMGLLAAHISFAVAVGVSVGAERGSVEFLLTAAKSEFVVGEPVLLKLNFRNEGQCPERLLAFFGPTEDWFTFRFRDERGQVYSHLTGVSRALGGVVRERHGVLLEPGETRYGYRPVFWGKYPGGGLVFPEAGCYEVWCEFSGWREPLISDTLAITVTIPSEQDREAFGLFADHSAAMLVATNSLYGLDDACEREAVERWEKILADWPQSPYAPYALYFIASYRRLGSDPAGAIELYGRLLEEYEPFPYTEIAEFNLVDCYRRLGMDDVAEGMLHDLVAKYPGSDLSQPAQLGVVE